MTEAGVSRRTRGLRWRNPKRRRGSQSEQRRRQPEIGVHARQTYAHHRVPITLAEALDGGFEAVFSSGPYVAGVHQAPDRETAQRWLGVISRRITGARP